ncbi:MAG: calcium-binding protein [Chloroflexota bacterium]|nr:calcium-binding protein [Chloroflexota bacterium]
MAVLQGVRYDNEWAALKASWEAHLTEHLTFPFEATVYEYQERDRLHTDDRVTIYGNDLLEELYGTIVAFRQRRGSGHIMLADLDVVDQDSPNYQLVQDYRVWYANH